MPGPRLRGILHTPELEMVVGRSADVSTSVRAGDDGDDPGPDSGPPTTARIRVDSKPESVPSRINGVLSGIATHPVTGLRPGATSANEVHLELLPDEPGEYLDALRRTHLDTT
jgi:hypothetical protein